MALENPWVTYLQRSYKSIKSSIITRMRTLVPEITDYSESNVFVIIVSAFSGLVEQLNYYIDNVAREMYITTARRYSSMIKLTRLIDYRVRARIAATVDITVTAIDSMGAPVAVSSDATITAGSIIKTVDNIEFLVTNDRTIFLGNSSVEVPARQVKLVTSSNIGTTSSNQNQAFKLAADYTHDTLGIVINAIAWELRPTLALSGPSEKHFIVEVNEAKEAWVIFGDGVTGAIPPTGQAVLATYYQTMGLAGNVDYDTIITWVSGKPSGHGAYDYTATNLSNAVGGLDVEDIDGIRKHAPLSLRTMDRAVTQQDHIDLALLCPGVGKAAVYFDTNLKLITFYIAPDGGGIAGGTLCTDLVNYFALKKMISTAIQASPCGESLLRITITATAKFRRSGTDTKADIENALLTYFGFNYSDVNKDIRKSDIISVVDNLDKVDFLSLDVLTYRPYPRTTAGTHALNNNWYAVVTNAQNYGKLTWRLIIAQASSRTARLYFTDPQNGIEIFDKTWTYPATDPGSANESSNTGQLQFAIWGASFSDGDQWSFTTYPYNQDIIFDDNTIPITKLSELSISVNEQNL